MLKNMIQLKQFFKKLFFYKFDEKPIVVVIPSYNNEIWYKKNLDSVFSQKYSNYRVIYINDCSSDFTGQLVKKYFSDNNLSSKTLYIKNEIRKGATANRYLGSHLCEDNEIVLILDGDDWLANDKVFQRINKIYSKENIWLTYGQFMRYPSGIIGQCKKLSDDYDFRKMDKWYTSHVRTYYAWLFKKIKKEDLIQEDGQFFSVSGDVAEMLPMLEMARNHIKFINEVLYVYNMQTSLNDFKINYEKQINYFEIILKKESYKSLDI